MRPVNVSYPQNSFEIPYLIDDSLQNTVVHVLGEAIERIVAQMRSTPVGLALHHLRPQLAHSHVALCIQSIE